MIEMVGIWFYIAFFSRNHFYWLVATFLRPVPPWWFKKSYCMWSPFHTPLLFIWGTLSICLRDISIASATQHHCQTLPSSSLQTLLTEFNTTDAWRTHYPFMRQYSCSTPQHGALSRIDLMLVHTSLLPVVDSAEYLPRVASDHSPGKIYIRLPNIPPRTKWFLNPFWLKILPLPTYFLDKWRYYFMDNEGCASLQGWFGTPSKPMLVELWHWQSMTWNRDCLTGKRN